MLHSEDARVANAVRSAEDSAIKSSQTPPLNRTLDHVAPDKPADSPQPAVSISTLTTPSPTGSVSFMQVPVCSVSGTQSLYGKALLDPASSASYVREDVAKLLHLSGSVEKLETSVVRARKSVGSVNVSQS